MYPRLCGGFFYGSIWKGLRRVNSHSELRSDLRREGLHHDLPVANHERVGSDLVHVCRGLGAPDDVSVIALDVLLPHYKRGSRLSELGKDALERGPDRLWCFEQTEGRKEQRFRSVICQQAF